jgi:hypothetical protein
VVLYAATEGVSPFRRSNTPATLQSVLNATPAPPAAAHGPLADAIRGLLQKDPARRPNAAQVRALLEATAHPPVPEPTQIVRTVEVPAGGGLRLGRKAWFGLGGAVVAAAVAAYLVIADPFAGPLPDGWTKKHTKDVAATLAVPADYQPATPDRKTDKTHWITYADYSGSIWIGLRLDRKAEDTATNIAGSAAAEMYDDDSRYKESGEYDLSMPANAKTRPEDQTYQGRKAAKNTVTYTTTDTQNPRPRELQIFYYRTSTGDMYKLTVSYPGKGDFTGRGREVARTAIANLGVDRL